MKYLKNAKSLTKYLSLLRIRLVDEPQLGKISWSKFHELTELTTFKKAEAIHATPQDLSTVLRWA